MCQTALASYIGYLLWRGVREDRPVHRDQLPAPEPLGRGGHQHKVFEVMLRLILVQWGRLVATPPVYHFVWV
jgi:hypothetical protein